MAKSSMKQQTADFLRNYQNNYSFYRIDGKENYESKRTGVTTAYPPILPMRISTVGKEKTYTTSKTISNMTPAMDENGNLAYLMEQIQESHYIDQKISFTLLINPETWNVSKTQSHNESYTRKGWVVQLWGPNQDTISSTGRTAAMMNAPVGLDNFNAEMSMGYHNFLSLMLVYRNNGYKFEDALAVNELTRVVKMVYGVEIEYDNQILMGHFNNFTLDEDAEHPYVFNYNFEFIISTLSPSSEVRGHYQPLPQNPKMIEGTEADPYSLTLVSDSYVKKATNIARPKPVKDTITEKIWGTRTGLTFDVALQMNLTDGSVEGNINLRRLLTTAAWDSATKVFRNKSGQVWVPGMDLNKFLAG